MSTGRIDIDVTGHIARLIINNPDKRNSLHPDMYHQIMPALDELAADRDVRVLLVRGEGPHFSAGSDIGSLDQLHKGELPVAAEEALAAFPKPVVAAIRGYCFGGGLQLVTACDIRIAADTALFSVPPAKLGIVYPLSATRRMISLIGPSATKYLIFSGDQINATRALHLGLVEELVSPDLLDARAEHIAQTIAKRSQLTLQATKEIIDEMVDGTLTDELVDAWVSEAEEGRDLAEGMKAFAARRTPEFTWNNEHLPNRTMRHG